MLIASENKPLSYQPNSSINYMTNSVDPDQPATEDCLQVNRNVDSERKTK